jgi:hypothetical protein
VLAIGESQRLKRCDARCDNCFTDR